LARRWFRFGKKQEEPATEQAAVQEEVAPPEAPTEPETAEPAVDETPTGQKKRRRRGSRGGRGRRKPVTAAAQAEDVAPAEAASEATPKAASRKADSKPDRRQARGGGRKRTPTKRAPLPAAKRELMISVDVGEQRVAILEDDRVAEVYLERPERRSIAGNIYLGVVDNVLPGMEAAFVEIGLEKNGFLYVDEIVGPELEGRKGARKIQDLIKRGQTIMVQAVKDPMKSKGARLTTEISLPGRFLVFVPNGEGSGVSRRLDDTERTRLKEILRKLDPKGGGIIVRTAAEGASAEDIERDLVFLQRLWKTIQAKAKTASAPALVYEEAELPLRIVRDLFAGDFVGAKIDDDRTHRRIVSYLKKTSPHMIERVHRYREKTPLFEASGVDAEIRSTLDRRVDLPSGGYLVFDYAEAFTVIDVNTGRFVGSRGKSAQGRLEDTIVKNNLEAVKEVVRQLRLRDIGGIIVIDFIDMANPKNRETVEEALRSELERDRTKTYVVEISPLGLVEMTRQNVTDGPREILTNRCPICAGDGVVVSDATHALEVERKLRAVAKGSRVQAFRIAVHPRVLAILAGPGGTRLEELEAAARRRFFLVSAPTNGHVHLDHFEVLDQGKVDALKPETPVEEGAKLDVKLVELGLYDSTSGVGKVDQYEIVVANAAKLVGKKVSVVVGRALDGVAYATLADAPVPSTVPITFEAEAEKPTRAPRGKKEAEELPDAEVGIVDSEEVDVEEEAAVVEETDVVEEAAPNGQPKKKRTRRGSRGGRGRKTAAAAPSAEAVDEEPAAESDGRPSPRIHVPPLELDVAAAPALVAVDAPDVAPASEDGVAEPAEDGQPKKKRSRRGSRGGKRRRKPAANGDGVTEAVADVAELADASVADVADPAEEEAGYVPMSEWIDDFDSRSRP
jgi:ribonuclease G